ncbi:hypothetical protein ACGF5S_32870 [Nocardia nova]|uniref:hypothetical protein n=1 Tax=Nocardia nova TaxID=37330 RepID=UPI00371126AA
MTMFRLPGLVTAGPLSLLNVLARIATIPVPLAVIGPVNSKSWGVKQAFSTRIRPFAAAVDEAITALVDAACVPRFAIDGNPIDAV